MSKTLKTRRTSSVPQPLLAAPPAANPALPLDEFLRRVDEVLERNPVSSCDFHTSRLHTEPVAYVPRSPAEPPPLSPGAHLVPNAMSKCAVACTMADVPAVFGGGNGQVVAPAYLLPSSTSAVHPMQHDINTTTGTSAPIQSQWPMMMPAASVVGNGGGGDAQSAMAAMFMQMASALMMGGQMPTMPSVGHALPAPTFQPPPIPSMLHASGARARNASSTHGGNGGNPSMLYRFYCGRCRSEWRKRVNNGQPAYQSCRDCKVIVYGQVIEGSHSMTSGPTRESRTPSLTTTTAVAASAPVPIVVASVPSQTRPVSRVVYERIPSHKLDDLHAPLRDASNEWVQPQANPLSTAVVAAPAVTPDVVVVTSSSAAPRSTPTPTPALAVAATSTTPCDVPHAGVVEKRARVTQAAHSVENQKKHKTSEVPHRIVVKKPVAKKQLPSLQPRSQPAIAKRRPTVTRRVALPLVMHSAPVPIFGLFGKVKVCAQTTAGASVRK